MIIQNNQSALYAANTIKFAGSKVNKSLEKLCSGYRINRGADDASGLGISEEMRAKITGLSVGINNIDQGIAVVQTADKALEEVSSMLLRAQELSLQAANGTLSFGDRESLNKEIQQITDEIDRIANYVDINGFHPLKFDSNPEVQKLVRAVTSGGELVIPGKESGNIHVDFNKIELKADLTKGPIDTNGDLNVGAKTMDDYDGNSVFWGLVFGNGHTSSPQLRVETYRFNSDGTMVTDPATGDPVKQKVQLQFGPGAGSDSKLKIDRASYSASSDGKTASVDYVYKQYTKKNTTTTPPTDDTTSPFIEIRVKQTITLKNKENFAGNPGGVNDSQFYNFSYEVSNTTNQVDFGAVYPGMGDVKVDFMHHMDTAYNNNDGIERYYVGGNRVTQATVYEKGVNMPNSFSIWGPVSELSFTGCVRVDGTNGPDEMMVGHYYGETRNWNAYDNPGSVNVPTPAGTDLGFGMVWKNRTLVAGASQTFSLDFGIVQKESDSNIDRNDDAELDLFITPVVTRMEEEYIVTEGEKGLWIQTEAREGAGFYVHAVDARTEALGLNPPPLDITSVENSFESLERIDAAMEKVSTYRAIFGADQNRLDRASKQNMISHENTSSSESRIRDLDMAKEMMSFACDQVVTQAAQGMLVQSIQTPERALSLIRQ